MEDACHLTEQNTNENFFSSETAYRTLDCSFNSYLQTSSKQKLLINLLCPHDSSTSRIKVSSLHKMA